MSSLEAGAEMITFLAPASTWARALVASVKKPVDSTTTSTPRSDHFSEAGSRSACTLICWSPTRMASSVALTSASSTPRIVSNLSRWARALGSVRSLTPTISMSASPAASRTRTARKKLRPMRPKPLMPTRTVTALFSWKTVSEATRRPYPAIGSIQKAEPSGFLGEHLRGQGRLGVRYAELLGPLVGHRQQAPDPAGDRVLGEHR